MLTAMPISCEMEDRKYFETVCKKREITKREFIHELLRIYKNNQSKENSKKQKKDQN